MPCLLWILQVLVSPLADVPVRADLDFEVPSCYKHNPPRLQPGYLAKFKEETLFYIFYSMPQVCRVSLSCIAQPEPTSGPPQQSKACGRAAVQHYLRALSAKQQPAAARLMNPPSLSCRLWQSGFATC